MNYFKQTKQSLHVVLDSNATIIDIESNIVELAINKSAYIGKNWFDSFIGTSDRNKAIEVFSELLSGKTEKKLTHHNDIKCKNGKHVLLDFESEVIIENDEKKVVSKGVLRYQPF